MLDLKLTSTDNRIITDIYRKTTHTDQYLEWSSHHPVQQKLGIVQTLMHWTDTLISDEGRRGREKENVTETLRNCGYPEWVLKEGEQRGKTKVRKEQESEAQLAPDHREGKSSRHFVYYHT